VSHVWSAVAHTCTVHFDACELATVVIAESTTVQVLALCWVHGVIGWGFFVLQRRVLQDLAWLVTNAHVDGLK
jgi:hypothetical protein